MQPLWALSLCLLLSSNGLKRKSLSVDGALAAFLVGMMTFTHHLHFYSVLLLVFYFSGSRVTKVKSSKKKELEEDHVEGGQRNAAQVFSNAFTGITIIAIHRYFTAFTEHINDSCFPNVYRDTLLFAYIGHYACCAGDTFASELGILDKRNPYLITTFKQVPPGTNGGVSLLGTLASIAGGLLIGISGGIVMYLQCSDPRFVAFILIGLFSGFLGSMIDSLLGATLQPTFYDEEKKKIVKRKGKKTIHVTGIDILTNNQVNFISSMLTSLTIGGVYFMLHSS